MEIIRVQVSNASKYDYFFNLICTCLKFLFDLNNG